MRMGLLTLMLIMYAYGGLAGWCVVIGVSYYAAGCTLAAALFAAYAGMCLGGMAVVAFIMLHPEPFKLVVRSCDTEAGINL